MQASEVDDSGFEWLRHGDFNWYRVHNTNDEWKKFEE